MTSLRETAARRESSLLAAYLRRQHRAVALSSPWLVGVTEAHRQLPLDAHLSDREANAVSANGRTDPCWISPEPRPDTPASAPHWVPGAALSLICIRCHVGDRACHWAIRLGTPPGCPVGDPS